MKRNSNVTFMALCALYASGQIPTDTRVGFSKKESMSSAISELQLDKVEMIEDQLSKNQNELSIAGLNGAQDFTIDSVIIENWGEYSGYKLGSKIVFEYLPVGNTHCWIRYIWNSQMMDWVPWRKSEFFYNVDDIPRMNMEYRWRDTLSQWDTISKSVYFCEVNEYDYNGLKNWTGIK